MVKKCHCFQRPFRYEHQRPAALIFPVWKTFFAQFGVVRIHGERFVLITVVFDYIERDYSLLCCHRASNWTQFGTINALRPV